MRDCLLVLSLFFQETMKKVLQGCPGVVVFLNDAVITGRNRQEHMRNVTNVLERLSKAGLKVNVEKCEFLKSEISYLSHIISTEGLRKDSSKVNAILAARMPTSKTEVRALVGLINYYSRFAPNLSQILRPIYNLLKDNVEFRW